MTSMDAHGLRRGRANRCTCGSRSSPLFENQGAQSYQEHEGSKGHQRHEGSRWHQVRYSSIDGEWSTRSIPRRHGLQTNKGMDGCHIERIQFTTNDQDLHGSRSAGRPFSDQNQVDLQAEAGLQGKPTNLQGSFRRQRIHSGARCWLHVIRNVRPNTEGRHSSSAALHRCRPRPGAHTTWRQDRLSLQNSELRNCTSSCQKGFLNQEKSVASIIQSTDWFNRRTTSTRPSTDIL